MSASVIGALQRTGRSLPSIIVQGLPWLLAAIAVGIAGSFAGFREPAWRITDLLISIGASAVLLACARSAFLCNDCPKVARPSKQLLTYLIWWIPLAVGIGLLQWVSIPPALGFGLALLLAAVLGWMTLLPLKRALRTGGSLMRRPGQVIRASLASLFCLVLPPAILILLLAPVIGTMAAVEANLDFLEQPWPSDGGRLTSAGIVSELVSASVPLLGASCVGFYQGALLKEWASSEARSESTPASSRSDGQA